MKDEAKKSLNKALEIIEMLNDDERIPDRDLDMAISLVDQLRIILDNATD